MRNHSPPTTQKPPRKLLSAENPEINHQNFTSGEKCGLELFGFTRSLCTEERVSVATIQL